MRLRQNPKRTTTYEAGQVKDNANQNIKIERLVIESQVDFQIVDDCII